METFGLGKEPSDREDLEPASSEASAENALSSEWSEWVRSIPAERRPEVADNLAKYISALAALRQSHTAGNSESLTRAWGAVADLVRGNERVKHTVQQDPIGSQALIASLRQARASDTLQ